MLEALNLLSVPEVEISGAEPAWGRLIPDKQWMMLSRAAATLNETNVRFLLGGGFALAAYTGHWRATKDIDLIVHAADREAAVDALRRTGFAECEAEDAYDRSGVFRGCKDGVALDVIWALPDRRVEIDEAWFERSRPVRLRTQTYAAVPPEELVRMKLYVMQRERCDWVDVLNVLATAVEQISWPWLVERMGRDLALLQGALALFNWMCPSRAHLLPAWLRKEFALSRVESSDLVATEARRVRLFDSRPWFAPLQPTEIPLER